MRCFEVTGTVILLKSRREGRLKQEEPPDARRAAVWTVKGTRESTGFHRLFNYGQLLPAGVWSWAGQVSKLEEVVKV